MEARLGKAPIDSDGFVQSFNTDQIAEYLKFFEEYGFVVIRGVLSPSQCQTTVDEVWRDVQASPSFEEPIKRDDPSTWGNDRWPQQQKLGILGSFPCIGKAALSNRQNPVVYEVFKNILKSEKLLVTFDRYGILRPAKDHPERKTLKDWVHWDLNPWTFKSSTIYFSNKTPTPGKQYNKKILKVQGLISLVDCKEEDGGFHTVPKFSKYCFDEWASQNEKSEHQEKFKDNNFVPVPKESTLFYNHLQKISMRAGSLVIWDSKQPHGNYPNDSNNFRICQYIKMISQEHVRDENLKRDLQGDPQYLVPPSFEITPLGGKLFGLKPWNAKRNSTLGFCLGVVAVVMAFGLYRFLQTASR